MSDDFYTAHECACGRGEKPCPGPDGRPLCAPSAFKIIEPYLDYINGTPDLIWGLMDINLMPEQVQTIRQAEFLVHIVKAHQNGEIPRNDDQ